MYFCTGVQPSFDVFVTLVTLFAKPIGYNNFVKQMQ